jgi:hypothetical protein
MKIILEEVVEDDCASEGSKLLVESNEGFYSISGCVKERHMEKIDLCHSCGNKKTIRHALFECTWAKLFWQEIKEVTRVKIPELHPTSWSMDIIDSNLLRPRDAAVILCGAWSIWSERNARKHGEQTRSISSQ